MSDSMLDAPDEGDARAAEFVLGVLDSDEQAAIERAAARDPALAGAITAWENRLAPLARLVDPVAPPADLWERLMTSVAALLANGSVVAFPPSRRLDERRAIRRWQAATAVSLALAASLAVVAALPLLRPVQRPIILVASLGNYGQPPSAFIATVDRGTLSVRPTAAVAIVPTDRAYELWALPPGAKTPAPLGLLPPTGATLAAGAAQPVGSQILISLEPRGGSPTGLPTGPVLFAGKLLRLD